jgi:hypothetical protein
MTMVIPPWFGDTGSLTQPDPLIYWIAASPTAYLWAICAAHSIAARINLKHRQQEEET